MTLSNYVNGLPPPPSQQQMSSHQCSYDCEEINIYLTFLSLPVLLYNFMTVLNLIIQLVALFIIRKGKKHNKGPFFNLLIVLSLSISFRTLLSFIMITISSFIRSNYDNQKIKSFVNQTTLYCDWISNFFSMSITFFMSLNRCLLFKNQDLNFKLFDGLRWIIIVLICFISSSISSFIAIFTSGITRVLNEFGSFDYGLDGWNVFINRLYYLFPIGSIICYFILYHFLIRQRKLMTQTAVTVSNRKKGEQKVFHQLLLTAVFYGLISLLFEISQQIDSQKSPTLSQTVSIFLNIFNYCPEITLPLFIIIEKLHLKKRFMMFMSPVQTNNVIAVSQRTTSGHS